MKKPQTKNLRWWIAGLLFASTVINYIDRQTLSMLAPYLKTTYDWTNRDYAMMVICFRLPYTIGQTVFGRLVDRLGTRRGLTISVTWYSIASMLTSLANGLYSFSAFRFLLGVGESANWPAGIKGVAEWFPNRERGWAIALFDSGSSIGGAIAPLLIIPIYMQWGWRPAFIIPGLLGFLWLIAWRRLYYSPESHPAVSSEERAMLLKEREAAGTGVAGRLPHWRELLSLRQTWGVIAARSFTDPVWFFITEWFAVYLATKGFQPHNTLAAIWIPFVAADLGNFFGGGMSSWLISRGWSVGRARKAVVVFGAVGMLALIPALRTTNLFAIAGLFAIATFAYAAYSTMAIVLATDLYQTEAVATVSGLSGTGAGIGTILSTYLIGKIADRYSFEPILVAASLIPVVGAVLVLILVRNSSESGKGILRRI